MRRDYLFIATVGLLGSVLAGAILFRSPIERAMWPSRPADLSNKIVPKPAASEPSALVDTAKPDRLDIVEPLPVPHRSIAPVDEIEEPIEPTTAPVEDFGQPTGLAAAAGREFAFDLYAQLATSPEGVGKNLFFSPHCLSSALIMAAEGARGETAEQMGKALHFPPALHRDGPDAATNPWDLTALHRDLAAVNAMLDGVPASRRQKMRERIAALRREMNDPTPPPVSTQPADGEDRLDGNTGLDIERDNRLAERINDLLQRVDPYELNVANALWVDKSYPLKRKYLDVIMRFYRTGGAFPVDFRNDGDGAGRQINAWVLQQTNGRIAELIPPGGVDPATAMKLTDAVYFKGEWRQPFLESATIVQGFAAAGGKIQVPMMHEDRMSWGSYGAFKANGSYFQTPKMILESKAARADDLHDASLYPAGGCLMLEMPYKGGALSMVVILPVDEAGLANLEKNLTATGFNEWTTKLDSRDVHAFIPKFRLQTSYDMIPALKSMGMNRAFVNPTQPSCAQFGGMCASDDPQLQLYISSVMHKTFVDVNEKGTEAAAVVDMTTLDFDVEEGERAVPFIPTFRADRPFIFAIRDRKTGTILFLGRVVDPQG